MNTITRTSTNGRSGMQVLVPEGVEDSFLSSPQEGTLESLGRMGGFYCFKFTPGKTGLYTVLAGDSQAHAGATVAHKEYLQSNDYATVLVLRPGAVWRTWGYKRRSSQFHVLNSDGKTSTPPVSVLLALKVIEPEQVPEPVEPPPDFDNPVLEALKKAGIL